MRILRAWREGRALAIADLKLIAGNANAAYLRCRSDAVSKDLIVANVSAFREAVKITAHGKTGKGNELDSHRYLANLATSTGKIDAKSLADSVDKWIARLPDLTSAAQAECASRNLFSFLLEKDCPDEAQLNRAIRPYLCALLQLAIRAHWYLGRRPLLGPEEQGSHPSRMTRLGPVRHGRIVVKALVRDQELALSLQLPGEQGVVTANNLVEVEDPARVTRLAVEGHDIRGEVFQWSKHLDKPKGSTPSTERGWWRLEASDVSSIGQALEGLFRESSIAVLAERSRFIY